MEESETYLRVNKGPRFFSLSIISTALKIGEFFEGGWRRETAPPILPTGKIFQKNLNNV